MYHPRRRPRTPDFSPLRPRTVAACLLLAGAALIAGCGGSAGTGPFYPLPPGGGGGDGGGGNPPPTAPAAFDVRTLSSRPDMVSGGDALIEVRAPEGVALDKVRVSLDGKDVSAQVPVFDRAARTLRGLVTGLTTDPASATGSLNLLVVSNADNAAQRTEMPLRNFPIAGPILSGPHLSPYECRTVENGLGAPLDADCSIATRVDWYYRTNAKTFKPLANPTGARPADLATTTTNDGVTVPYIVRVETGTINRGIYRLAVLDDPVAGSAAWKPGRGWNRKLVVYFEGGANAQYNQGVYPVDPILSDRELSRGFAFMNSTELINNQHANPHLQGETLMMLKEHFIEAFGTPPKWTAGLGGSGGAIQQYLIAQLFPGLLDGLQPVVSFPETLMPEVMECRLLNNVYNADTATWTAAKQQAVNGFNAGTCAAWDQGFASYLVKSDFVPGCGFTEPANTANIFNRGTNPGGVRCEIFQTNANLLGKRAGTQEARRPLDNVGVQYGLAAVNGGAISVTEFLDLNERVGGFDRDGNTQAARTEAETEALRLTYSGGLKNSFSGPGLANVPVISQRGNADAVGDVHDPMQDLIVRARLQRANGRADNQIIWSLGLTSGVDYLALSLDVMNKWLDNIAADPAPASTAKVVRNKPAGAADACWDKSGARIDEAASTDPATRCNGVYPRASTPRLNAGSPMVNDVMKCQLQPVSPADYAVNFSGPELVRLRTIFAQGVCDWRKPSVGQEPLRGSFLRLPLN